MGAQAIEHNVEFFLGVGGFQLRDELQELLAPLALFTGAMDASGRHFQGREKRGGAVPFVFMGEAGERAPVGILSQPWARSSAWMQGFSSTAMTTAFCGGAR